MSNSNLFIAGSIHQGSERFSDISHGRQCSFMSFSALLFAQTLPIEQWITCNVDHILAQGDRFYVDALCRTRKHLRSEQYFKIEIVPYLW